MHNASVVVFLTIAQDLLEQWAADKLNFSDAYLDNDYSEVPGIELPSSKTAVDIKREWDQLTELDTDGRLDSICDKNDTAHASHSSKPQKTKGRKSDMQSFITSVREVLFSLAFVCLLTLLCKKKLLH